MTRFLGTFWVAVVVIGFSACGLQPESPGPGGKITPPTPTPIPDDPTPTPSPTPVIEHVTNATVTFSTDVTNWNKNTSWKLLSSGSPITWSTQFGDHDFDDSAWEAVQHCGGNKIWASGACSRGTFVVLRAKLDLGLNSEITKIAVTGNNISGDDMLNDPVVDCVGLGYPAGYKAKLFVNGKALCFADNAYTNTNFTSFAGPGEDGLHTVASPVIVNNAGSGGLTVFNMTITYDYDKVVTP